MVKDADYGKLNYSSIVVLDWGKSNSMNGRISTIVEDAGIAQGISYVYKWQ